MSWTTSKTFYVIRATKLECENQWVRKSSRDGRGIWVLTDSWDYAERMEYKRARNALKVVGLKRIKENYGVDLQILKVEAAYAFEKVWPLSPLEALAQVAE